MLVLRDGGDVPGESERNQLLPSGLPRLLPSPVVTREQVKPGPEPAQLARLPPLARLWDGVQQGAWSISLFNFTSQNSPHYTQIESNYCF